MVEESELVRTLRNHKGLNDLQMWRMQDEAATRIAALEAQLAERVKVKSLEWQDGVRISISTLGDFAYSATYCTNGRGAYFWSVHVNDRYLSKHETLDEAKAAAQADFDRRILSALEATPPAPKVTDGHPMQPLVVDKNGVHRFKRNKCVEALLDHGRKTGFGLNELARQEHTTEDRMQLAQLIGYSVSGYGDLGYVSDASCDLAAKQSQALTAAQDKED